MSYTPETHLEYARRVGAPRVVECDIDLGGGGHSRPVWICRTHDYGFNEREQALDLIPGWDGYEPRRYARRQSDRCPMSRLEEWRARSYEYWADAVLAT